MNSKVQRYLIEALAMTGFCVLNAGIAFQLRPDIWATRMNAGGDFSDAHRRLHERLLSLPGVILFEIQLAGDDDWHLVATRSTSDLHARIEQITGLAVTGLRSWAAVDPAPSQPVLQADGDPIPIWPCIARTEALRKAGIADETYRQPARLAPPRKSL